MSSTLVDTHAHLDGPEYASDLHAVLDRAREAGIAAIVSCGQDQATSRATIALAAQHPLIAPAVGVHPHQAKDAGDDLEWLAELLGDPCVLAAGEMGLDYHYDFSPRATQRDVFARQLQWAQERSLPAIIHCREADDDVMSMLAQHWTKSAPAVVHCFTGNYDRGMQFIEQGAYLGIGGAVTFKKAIDLHDAVARLPLDRLVLETDCPFMTPTPHRGKRNEPALMVLTCEAIAQLRGLRSLDVAQATTDNASRLFSRLSLHRHSALP